MALSKAKGNMYSWVTNVHTHLGGKCPHGCNYCYVQNMHYKPEKYKGDLRLIEKELDVNYGKDKTIFIEHCNDLFATALPDEWRLKILEHCRKYPDNTYVFQTKNPSNYLHLLDKMPEKSILGVTIETNRHYPEIMMESPTPKCRYISMIQLIGSPTFITIEPILAFDLDILAHWIMDINPTFVNIGADSKGRGLPEPSWQDIQMLIRILRESGIKVNEKSNLKRLEVK